MNNFKIQRVYIILSTCIYESFHYKNNKNSPTYFKTGNLNLIKENSDVRRMRAGLRLKMQICFNKFNYIYATLFNHSNTAYT